MKTVGRDIEELHLPNAENMHLIRTIEVIPQTAVDITGIDWLYMSPAGDQLIVNVYGDMIYVYQVVP